MFKLLICCLLWLSCEASRYVNPIARSSPDPWVVYHDGHYHLTATTGSNLIKIRKAKTLGKLADAENEVVYAFDGHTMYAPEIHRVDGKWYLFYSACALDNQNQDCHRNHVAQSATDDPMGPYEFLADLDDPEDESPEIDPSYIIINDKQYLMGAYYDPSIDKQSVYIRPMANPSTPTGHKHLIASPEYDWETHNGNIVEAPEPLYHDGKIFITYSASHCISPDYTLGLLEFVGTDPLNSAHWKKHPNPVFVRNEENHVYGPGHNGFFKSPDGKEDWIVYHANEKASQGCGVDRSTRAQKFTWGKDGLPVFGVPEAVNVSYEGPAGE